jgi:dethiobiotin synthetase
MWDEWVNTLAALPGIFVTGTDTGIGKTWVGVHLIRHLRTQGVDIAPRKPVESGWQTDTAQTDAGQLAAAANWQGTLEQVCPNRFQAALSPPRAAQREGKVLQVAALARQCREGLTANPFLYVEGAGGFYSPIAHDGLNADLAQQLGLPVVLVSEDRVGCINHVLLVAEALQHRQLRLAGVILNPRQPAVEGMDNLADLRHLLAVPVMRCP